MTHQTVTPGGRKALSIFPEWFLYGRSVIADLWVLKPPVIVGRLQNHQFYGYKNMFPKPYNQNNHMLSMTRSVCHNDSLTRAFDTAWPSRSNATLGGRCSGRYDTEL